MNSVRATKVSDVFESETPGVYQFKDGRILFTCPCGCGSMMNLPVRPESEPHPTSGVSWTWDGNEESPTLSPSIRDMSGCRFHGYLQRGEWSFCSDSGVR